MQDRLGERWRQRLVRNAEPSAAFIESPSHRNSPQGGTSGCDTGKKERIVPALSVFEVFKRVLQQRDEASVLQAAALMQQGRAVALHPALAMTSAKLSLDLRLPMADSIILATARQFNALPWTQAADSENLPGVRYITAARPTA